MRTLPLSSDVFQIDVINTLIKEQGKGVAAEFGMIHPAAQEVCSLGKESVEFSLGETPLRPCFHRIIHFHSPIFVNSLLIFSKLPHI